jgi:PadR family transcriptional regulator AphA
MMTVADDEQADDPSAGERRLSLAEWLVLCLVREGPAYGHALAGLLARGGSVGRIWSVPRATVYRILQRLELLGLIRAAGEQRAISGPARSVCTITAAGQAVTQAWLITPVEHSRDVMSELMIKLALLDRAGADSKALVRAQHARLLPVAAALDDRLSVTTGFEHTLVLWRHETMTATMQFLEILAEGQGPAAVHQAATAPAGNGKGSSALGAEDMSTC